MQSFPLGVSRSNLSGPWTLEWLTYHHHGDANIISSTENKVKKSKKKIVCIGGGSNLNGLWNEKKAGGLLKHSIHNLKKGARLLGKHRKEVLKVLKKNVKRRREVNQSRGSVGFVSSGVYGIRFFFVICEQWLEQLEDSS
jgi:hypothetical protein